MMLMKVTFCGHSDVSQWDNVRQWLCETVELSYLCWTYSPEVSYSLEYNPAMIADEKIIKKAEGARPINEEYQTSLWRKRRG